MEDIRERQTSRGAMLSPLIIIVLLMAMMAQSAHLCGPLASAPDNSARVDSVAATAGPCLICLMAQPATAVLFLLLLLFLILRRPPAALVEQHLHSLLQSFRLYVRPPPVL
jgi:hypothetical protein